MFLREYHRTKDGKRPTYFPLVESHPPPRLRRRVAGVAVVEEARTRRDRGPACSARQGDRSTGGDGGHRSHLASVRGEWRRDLGVRPGRAWVSADGPGGLAG